MRSAKIYQGESSCISPFQDMHIEIFGMFNLEKNASYGIRLSKKKHGQMRTEVFETLLGDLETVNQDEGCWPTLKFQHRYPPVDDGKGLLP